jgi:2-polyprenyl-6-methoxyphenol hydroxylase-like FAD-dependent oxidoreductase
MSGVIANRAVVIGAGMGGLTAAAALTGHFAQVIVLELDELPGQPAQRPNVPHGRHAHALLGGGLRALEELLPGFGDNLEAAGAVRYRAGLDIRYEHPEFHPLPQRDLGWHQWAMSRPLIEFVARQRVSRLPGVSFRTHCRARELIPTTIGGSVQGVRVESKDSDVETLAADLVIDASGRGMPTLAYLKASGYGLPEESSIGIDVTYASAMFAIPDDAPTDWKGAFTYPNPPSDGAGGALFPLEGSRWLLTVSARHGKQPPGDPDGFMKYVEQLRTPTLYRAIRDAERIGDIARFRFPASARRHFERLDAFPRGLLPIADAICHFNPVYGQGMSVAALEACRLKSLLTALSKDEEPLAQLALPYFSAIATIIETPWGVANLDFAYPQTTGTRPEGIEGTLRFTRALTRLAARDPAIHKQMMQVQQLLLPRDVYREPSFVQRIQAEIAAL